MRHLRRDYNRDKAEAPIVDYLVKAGCQVIRINQPVDLVIGIPHLGWLLAEVKSWPPGTKKGEPTPSQRVFIDNSREKGLPVVVLRDLDDCAALLEIQAPSEALSGVKSNGGIPQDPP